MGSRGLSKPSGSGQWEAGEDWEDHSEAGRERMWAGSVCRRADSVLSSPWTAHVAMTLIVHLLICLQIHYTYCPVLEDMPFVSIWFYVSSQIMSISLPWEGVRSRYFRESVSGCWVKAVDSSVMSKLWLQKNTKTMRFNFFPNQFIK